MIPLKHLHVVLIYLVAIRSSFARLLPKGRKNIVTFFMYGIDNWRSTSGRLLPTGRKKAKNSKWRIRQTVYSDLMDKYENPMSAMISCNDGFRPFSFYIEVIE